MIVGIILIIIAFIILSPVMIILIKGLCNAIYSAWRYDEVDEIYGVAVVVGIALWFAGMACVLKYHKPEPKETQTIQQESEMLNENKTFQAGPESLDQSSENRNK